MVPGPLLGGTHVNVRSWVAPATHPDRRFREPVSQLLDDTTGLAGWWSIWTTPPLHQSLGLAGQLAHDLGGPHPFDSADRLPAYSGSAAITPVVSSDIRNRQVYRVAGAQTRGW